MLPAFFLSAGLLSLQSDDFKGTDVLEVLAGLHAPIRDISFHWEGQREFVGAAAKEVGSSNRPTRFTGTCAYRRTDGILWFEVFTHREGAPLSIERRAYFGREQRVLRQTPDRGQSSGELSAHDGWPDGCVAQSLFGQIFYVSYFDNLAHGDSHEIEFKGYEKVDRYRCAHITIRDFAKVGNTDTRHEFWIDLERGGHPLRMEEYGNFGFSRRLHSVRLEKVDDRRGNALWLPTNGEMDGYLWDVGERGKHEIKSLKEPANRETVTLLRDSFQLNAGIPDERFRLEFPTTAKVTDRRTPRRETGEAVAELPVGSKGVPDVVASTLSSAERQRIELEAGSRARQRWSWGSLLSYTLLLGGAGAVMIAIFLRFARRG